MKKEILVVNDVHIGSKYCDFTQARNTINNLTNDGFTVLNGDIVDMACCPKRDVKKLREYQASLIKKFGDYYVRGNHDLIPDHSPHVIIGDTIFTHGHLLGKRADYWRKYENKKAGASWLKLLWVDFADDMDWIKGKLFTVKEDVVKGAINLAKFYGCKQVVMGHFHPLNDIIIEREGVRIIILKKGFNQVEVEL